MATAMVRATVAKVISKVANNPLPVFQFQHRKTTGVLVGGLVLAMISVSLHARSLKIEPGVSLKAIYTDNADLSSSGKKSKFYNQVRPTLGLNIDQESGGRIQLDFDYSMDYTEDLPGKRGRRIAHKLAANMQAELYRDIVFLDASAGAGLSSRRSGGQTGYNSIGAGYSSVGAGYDSVGDTRDPVQTYTFSLSPYTKHHFGRYADLLARYTYDQVTNSGTAFNSFSNSILISLSSGTHFSRMPWSLSYKQSKVDRQDGAYDSQFSSINSNISYILNRKWRLNLGLGKTDNNFTSSRSSSTDSVTWDAGATWTPTPRTNLGFSYGRQFFGENFAFDFSHRWRRAVWTASYSKKLTNWRTQQLAQRTSFIGSTVDFGASLPFSGNPYTYRGSQDNNGQTIYVYGLDFDLPTLTDEQYVISTFNTGFSLNTRRSTLSVDAHYTTRRYEVTQNNGRDYGLNVNLSRKLSSKTNANTGLFWQKNRQTEGGPEDTRITFNAGVARQLTERTNASLRYQHRRLDSGSSGNAREYQENQISLTLDTHW